MKLIAVIVTRGSFNCKLRVDRGVAVYFLFFSLLFSLSLGVTMIYVCVELLFLFYGPWG